MCGRCAGDAPEGDTDNDSGGGGGGVRAILEVIARQAEACTTEVMGIVTLSGFNDPVEHAPCIGGTPMVRLRHVRYPFDRFDSCRAGVAAGPAYRAASA